jgi:hypothetical protein
MYQFKRSFVAFLGLSAVVGMTTLFTPRQSYGNNDPVGPVKPVKIVNTPAEAVPTVAQGITQVAGQVSIANTPDVHVTNTPNVFVTNALKLDPSSSVTVGNTAANPVPVTVTAQPVRQPVHASSQLFNGDADTASGVIYTVPAGKLLVIEFFSAELDPDSGIAYLFLATELSPGSSTLQHLLAPNHPDLFAVTHQVRIYAGAGTNVVAGFRMFDSEPTSAKVMISGYLEDMP